MMILKRIYILKLILTISIMCSIIITTFDKIIHSACGWSDALDYVCFIHFTHELRQGERLAVILVLLEARHVVEALFVELVHFIVIVLVYFAVVVCEAYDYSLTD